MAASHERHRCFLAAPRGILKIRIFLTPFGVASRCFRHSRWLVVNVRHSGMWDARGCYIGLSSVKGGCERPACPNVLMGFRSLSDALFGACQKVIRGASEDVSHLLETV